MSTSVIPSKETLIEAMNIILRSPAIFILNAYCKTDPKSTESHWILLLLSYGKDVGLDDDDRQLISQILGHLTLILATSLVLLPIKKIIDLYGYIMSGLLILAANHLSYTLVGREFASDGNDFSKFEFFRLNTMYVFAQCIIASVVSRLLGLRHKAFVILFAYTIPFVAKVLEVPPLDLIRIHGAVSSFVLLAASLFVFGQLPFVFNVAKQTMQEISIMVQIYGWIPYFLVLKSQIMLTLQFLFFWVVSAIIRLVGYSMENKVWKENWHVRILYCLSDCCDTWIAFTGLCVAIMYASWILLSVTKIFLKGYQYRDGTAHNGVAEGITMFILGFQTGVVEMKAIDRYFLLSILLFIVLSSLIQSMYEISDPVLLSLAASQNPSILRHVQVVTVCTFLWIFPLYMTFEICQIFELDFWLLVMTSSCVLTSLQVLGSLVVYSLLIYDAICVAPWERLDDVIYITKCATRVSEFIVAVIIVIYGIERSMFGTWNWLNLSILIIHCYFNVWQRLQSGWSSFLLRRDAAHRITALPDASAQQLRDHDDVCAVCYQEMSSAKITPCRHFFHGVCLKKWLYVQYTCPICHQKIDSGDKTAEAVVVPSPDHENNVVDHGDSTENDIATRQVPSTHIIATETTMSTTPNTNQEQDTTVESNIADMLCPNIPVNNLETEMHSFEENVTACRAASTKSASMISKFNISTGAESGGKCQTNFNKSDVEAKNLISGNNSRSSQQPIVCKTRPFPTDILEQRGDVMTSDNVMDTFDDERNT